MGRYWELLTKWSAWLLIIVLVLEFISGYAISHFRIFRVLIGKANAFKLHQTIQPVAVFFILAHVFPHIRRLVLKTRLERIYIADAILLLFLFGVFGGSLYLFLI
ncbi:hypothetical protein K9M06_01955 [Candidatus Bipolaricaulota bacterium]|nr:hypothetical protein [Candidatus Bipolaricaulota bacterium]